MPCGVLSGLTWPKESNKTCSQHGFHYKATLNAKVFKPTSQTSSNKLLPNIDIKQLLSIFVA